MSKYEGTESDEAETHGTEFIFSLTGKPYLENSLFYSLQWGGPEPAIYISLLYLDLSLRSYSLSGPEAPARPFSPED